MKECILLKVNGNSFLKVFYYSFCFFFKYFRIFRNYLKLGLFFTFVYNTVYFDLESNSWVFLLSAEEWELATFYSMVFLFINGIALSYASYRAEQYKKVLLEAAIETAKKDYGVDILSEDQLAQVNAQVEVDFEYWSTTGKNLTNYSRKVDGMMKVDRHSELNNNEDHGEIDNPGADDASPLD